MRLCGVFSLAALLSLIVATSAGAAQAPVGLGTAGSFAVLGGSTVTNTGPTVVHGDLGVSPGSAVTGFPPGQVQNGTIHAADAVAAQAQSDTTTAYNDAAGRTPAVSVSGDIGGSVLTPGVYKSTSSLGLTGDVTLDAQGDPSAVFIFQIGSTLITAPNSRVVLTNGADACNVFWQVGSSATLDTGTTFKGTILALTNIAVNTNATVDGRTLARNAAVNLDSNTITRSDCATTPGGTTPGGTTPGGTTPGGTTPGGTTPGGTTPGGTTPGGTTPGGTTPAGEGTAILTPRPRPNGCVEGFRAIVRGLHIKQVVFSIDGHVLATRSKSPFAVSVPYRTGSHTVTARVTFTDSTSPANLRLRYRSCARAGTSVLGGAPPVTSHSCTRGFRASVAGRRIRRVVFSLDRHYLATRTRAPFSVRVPRLAGAHAVSARVTFTDSTRAKTLRMRYRACAAAIRPAFTG